MPADALAATTPMIVPEAMLALSKMLMAFAPLAVVTSTVHNLPGEAFTTVNDVGVTCVVVTLTISSGRVETCMGAPVG